MTSSSDLSLWGLLPVAFGGWSDAHVSMASSSGGSGEIGCSLGRKSEKGGQAARRKAAPRGAKGWLRVSMCQIAWARRRAMSTWGDLGAALLSEPALGSLVALGVGV